MRSVEALPIEVDSLPPCKTTKENLYGKDNTCVEWEVRSRPVFLYYLLLDAWKMSSPKVLKEKEKTPWKWKKMYQEKYTTPIDRDSKYNLLL